MLLFGKQRIKMRPDLGRINNHFIGAESAEITSARDLAAVEWQADASSWRTWDRYVAVVKHVFHISYMFQLEKTENVSFARPPQ